MIRISRSLIFLIVFYLLGYTSFLGGPFGLAKFIFVVTLVMTILISFFSWRVKIFSSKATQQSTKTETIKVDAKVIE